MSQFPGPWSILPLGLPNRPQTSAKQSARPVSGSVEYLTLFHIIKASLLLLYGAGGNRTHDIVHCSSTELPPLLSFVALQRESKIYHKSFLHIFYRGIQLHVRLKGTRIALLAAYYYIEGATLRLHINAGVTLDATFSFSIKRVDTHLSPYAMRSNRPELMVREKPNHAGFEPTTS